MKWISLLTIIHPKCKWRGNKLGIKITYNPKFQSFSIIFGTIQDYGDDVDVQTFSFIPYNLLDPMMELILVTKHVIRNLNRESIDVIRAKLFWETMGESIWTSIYEAKDFDNRQEPTNPSSSIGRRPTTRASIGDIIRANDKFKS